MFCSVHSYKEVFEAMSNRHHECVCCPKRQGTHTQVELKSITPKSLKLAIRQVSDGSTASQLDLSPVGASSYSFSVGPAHSSSPVDQPMDLRSRLMRRYDSASKVWKSEELAALARGGLAAPEGTPCEQLRVCASEGLLNVKVCIHLAVFIATWHLTAACYRTSMWIFSGGKCGVHGLCFQ